MIDKNQCQSHHINYLIHYSSVYVSITQCYFESRQPSSNSIFLKQFKLNRYKNISIVYLIGIFILSIALACQNVLKIRQSRLSFVICEQPTSCQTTEACSRFFFILVDDTSRFFRQIVCGSKVKSN